MLNLIPPAQETSAQSRVESEPLAAFTQDAGPNNAGTSEIDEATRNAQTEVVQNVIQLGTELQYLLEPKTIQLNTPHHIPALELQVFLKQKSQLLCLTQDKLVVPVTLSAVEEHVMVAGVDSEHSQTLRHRQTEVATVLFLGAQNQNYLVYTKIAKVSATEVHFTYQDPRTELRVEVDLNKPAVISDLRPEKFLQLVVGSVEPIRETTRLLAHPQRRSTVTQIEDILRQKDRSQFFRTDEYIDAAIAIPSRVHDLSAGGVHLVIEDLVTYEFQENRIHHLTIELCAPDASSQEGRHNVTLQILALCRGVKYRAPSTHLHCRFLCPLPDGLIDSLYACPQSA